MGERPLPRASLQYRMTLDLASDLTAAVAAVYPWPFSNAAAGGAAAAAPEPHYPREGWLVFVDCIMTRIINTQ